MAVDKAHIRAIKGPLREILTVELKSENTICETWQGSWGEYENITFVMFDRSFTKPERAFKNIEYSKIDDKHYWKSQYFDKENGLILACGFKQT